MVSASIYQFVLELLQSAAGNSITSLRFIPVGGGSINETYQVVTNTGQRFFVKINQAKELPGLFRAEKEGLDILASASVIRTPTVIGCGEAGAAQVLLLEWIEQGLKSPAFWQCFGEQLAALHATSTVTLSSSTAGFAPEQPDRGKEHGNGSNKQPAGNERQAGSKTPVQPSFGLATDNYMGALPQHNEPLSDWSQFFIRRRLEPQLKLAVDNHLMTGQQVKQFEKLYQALPAIFGEVQPALLHGDLWSGNFLCDEAGKPVLIDPAVYYGIPAVDLAMTNLFGGFDAAFYDSYRRVAPWPPNFREQWEVANLYPLLIHLNLFGKGYLPDILRTIDRY